MTNECLWMVFRVTQSLCLLKEMNESIEECLAGVFESDASWLSQLKANSEETSNMKINDLVLQDRITCNLLFPFKFFLVKYLKRSLPLGRLLFLFLDNIQLFWNFIIIFNKSIAYHLFLCYNLLTNSKWNSYCKK